MNIAALLTCHNRREKTLRCLARLFAAQAAFDGDFSLTVFLTDDGCTDGTPEAVREKYADKKIHIVQGNGSCYWAGGMRLAWQEALKTADQWDFYLLVNDDTFAFDNLFDELFSANNYAIKQFGRTALCSGVTCDTAHPEIITYGGDHEDWLCRLHRVIPNGTPQLVDEANANMLLVSKDIVRKLGTFYKGYKHGGADYDYTRMARRKHIPVLITAHVCASCDYDHDSNEVEADKLFSMNLSQRRAYLNHPLHSDAEYLLYVRRNMPLRLPLTWTLRRLRLYCPHLYYFLFKLRGIH
jgi:GT2 family glycosyltransferase